MQKNVEVDQVKVLEGLVGSRGAQRVEIGLDVHHLRGEKHDGSRRELVRDDDLGIGTLGVLSDVLLGKRDINEQRGETLEDLGVLGVVVGRDLDGSTGDVLGLLSRELDGVD